MYVFTCNLFTTLLAWFIVQACSLIFNFINESIRYRITGTVFSTTHDFPWSGFKQNDKGLLFDMELNPTGTSKHNIQYEAAFRNVTCSKQASFRVREQSGPNLKSALRYIWTKDKRDSPIFPIAGSLMRLTTELAGLGGDVGFLKNELTIQSNWSLHECMVSIYLEYLRSCILQKKIRYFFLQNTLFSCYT